MDREKLIQDRAALVMQILQLETFLKDPILAEHMVAGVAKASTLVNPITQQPTLETTQFSLAGAKQYFEEQLKENENAFRRLMSEVSSKISDDEHS